MYNIGLIGLGPMGKALARNLSNKKIKTLVWNRTYKKTKEYIKEFGNNYLEGQKDLKTFIKNIERPRKIILFIQSGGAIDEILEKILPFLNKEDIIVDMANEHYKNTEKRTNYLQKKKIHFCGCGISGGEDGALKGSSIMFGGSKEAFKQMKKYLEKISAKDFKNKPCVTYIGPGGSGHYVKMIHNGIEYGIMQIMAETYEIFRKLYNLETSEISKIFAKWNKGKLKSFLFEIAVPVLSKKCEENKKSYLIEKILDSASQKGTGKWASLDALDRGVAFPNATQAVFARYISGEKNKRLKLSKLYKLKSPKIPKPNLSKFIDLMEDTLYSCIIIAFAQGYELMEKTSNEEKWNLNLKEISRIWQEGCIIRAKVLKEIEEAFSKKMTHLFEDKKIVKILKSNIEKIREVDSLTTKVGIATPGISSALFYFEYMIQDKMPTNFIQGLRDYFGAHTYERIDKKGSFHTDWK